MREFSTKEKRVLIQDFWTSWNQESFGFRQFPNLVKALLQTGAWREHVDGEEGPKTFAEFIRSQPRKGCGWTPEDERRAEKVLSDFPDILAEWQEALTNKPGAAGYKGVSQESKEPDHDARRGNSKSYTIRRLYKQHPELFQRVLSGELSPNGAAIIAGFRKKPVPKISLLEKVRGLVAQLSEEDRASLLKELSV